MKQDTLLKANALNEKIKQFSEALNCFEWETAEGKVISLNPRLIIEFDDEEGDRAQIKLPMNLSQSFIDFMRVQIIEGRDAAIKEFENL